MAATPKIIENANRLRYMRALERFHKSIVTYLATAEGLTKEGYCKKCESAKKVLDRVSAVALYKGDLQDLETLVKRMIDACDSQELSIEEIKEDILYRANQLDKTKNARRYKKEKYHSKQFEEWY